jgi:flavin reductase (DIM6/NTAB) family NADH-FMN oxidoreductase RutF
MTGRKPAKQVAFPLKRAFTLVESGPVLLISTRRRDKNNLLTVSCHASMGFEPTLGICLGPCNRSHLENVRGAKEGRYWRSERKVS